MNFNLEKFLSRIPLSGLSYTIIGSFALAFISSLGILSLIKGDAKKLSVPSGDFVIPSVKLYSDEEYKGVLDRNIFNMNGEVPEEDIEKEETVRVKDEIKRTSLPLKLVGLIFSGDPSSGLAVISDTKNKKVETFLVGDYLINEASLFEVHSDRIIIDRGGYKEFLELEVKDTNKNSRKIVKAAAQKKSTYALETPPDFYQEEGFERKGNQINISEDFKQKLLSVDFAKILQDVKAVPHIENNELKGYRMTKLKEGSIYQKMGLQTNDVIREINGFVLDDASQVLMYLQSLRAEKEFEVEVLRSGKTHVIQMQVQ